MNSIAYANKGIPRWLVGTGVAAVALVGFIEGRGLLMNSSYKAPAIVSSQQEINLLDEGEWDYLPGTSRVADGLEVRNLGRAIVQQDGSGGQTNSPVNIYGTHLAAAENFEITAGITNAVGPAVLRLYDTVPVIQDEFRVEPSSLEVTLDGLKLTLMMWQGAQDQKLSNQKPVFTKSYPYKSQSRNTVSITHQGSQVTVTINGQRLDTQPDRSVFKSGNIWFGADAPRPGGSWKLNSLRARSLGDTAIQSVDTTQQPAVKKTEMGLQQLARSKRPEFLIGTAMALGPAVADSEYADIAFGGNFGSLTTENGLKWQFIHPQPDVYDFKETDALVALAKKNNLVVHGHTLVFGEANPRWVLNLPTKTTADKQKVRQVMTEHIATTVGHFKGRVASWDVINEPLADYDDFSAGNELRKHTWFQAMGKEYLVEAVRAARAADPGAEIWINDYGLEENGERRDAMLQLVAWLRSQGTPVDGVGFEAHVYERGDKINPNELRDGIRAFEKIGVKTRISEIDVFSDDGTVVQAQQYADVLKACIGEPNCVSYTTWGITDRYDMWQDDNGKLQMGQDFLWDNKARPTPAVLALQKLLQ